MTAPTMVGSLTKAGSEPIPGYRVEELLGRGSFGEVWRARSPGDTHVALKFLQLSGVHGWKEFRAVQRVKQIRHPNLMPIIAIWLLDEAGAIIGDDVMDTIDVKVDQTLRPVAPSATLVAEPVRQSRRPAQMIIANLLADGTLGDRLRECLAQGLPGIPPGELLRYMEEAAKGLDFLNVAMHQIGDSRGSVQHCDVKPDNIMLTGGSAIVSDFGVAQVMAEAANGATNTSFGGSPVYMAPECFKSKTSHATDQYALAVTFYELLTGRVPFLEQTYAAVYEAHKAGKLDFSGIEPRIEAVLRKATSPDPDRRFASCVEFVQHLEEAAAPRSALTAPRRVKTIVAAATAAALAMGALVYALVAPGSANDLAQVSEFARQRQYEAAATVIRSLDKPADVNVAVKHVIKSLDLAPELPDASVAGLIKLVSGLRDAKHSGQIDTPAVEQIGERIEICLEARLQEIRNLCDAWDPPSGGQAEHQALAERIDSMFKLLDAAASQRRLAECQRCWGALQVQEIRMLARASEASWPELQGRLPQPDAIRQPIELSYARVLGFLFSGGETLRGIEHEPDEGRKAQLVAERLKAYLQFSAEETDLAPAAWEARHIAGQLQQIDAVIQWQWLGGTELGQIVRQVAVLPKSTFLDDPLPRHLDKVAEYLAKQQFGEARQYLDAAITGAARGVREQLAVERALVDLLDPGVPLASLHDVLASADLASLAAAAARTHDKLLEALAGATNQFAPQRAAVLELIRCEAKLRDGAPLDVEIEPLGEHLAGTELEAYFHYVAGMSLASGARSSTDAGRQEALWRDACRELHAAFAASTIDPILATSARRAGASTALVDAVEHWSQRRPPTDRDYGAAGVFGGRGVEAYLNFRLARRLRPAAVGDAYLLAAALAAGDDYLRADAAELLQIADKIVASANQGGPAPKDLMGTVHAARFAMQIAIKADPAAALSSAAEAMRRLYLDEKRQEQLAERPSVQLARLKAAVVDPALPLAQELWLKHQVAPLDAESKRLLATIYRTAGFLWREPPIAQAVIIRQGKPDEEAYEYFARANELESDVPSLIEQGLALSDASRSFADWREQLIRIATAAVDAASQQDDATLRGRALALQAYASLMASRDERQPVDARLQDLTFALEHIENAVRAIEAAGEKPADYAQWLITRATIKVEAAHYASYPFDQRQQLLSSASQDASEAAGHALRKNPEYAYCAWGNALEDLAFYLYIDQQKNFDEACRKFREAIVRAKPSVGPAVDYVALPYARHLPAVRNLLRCRVRLAESATLASVEEERALLQQTLEEAAKELPSLEPQDSAGSGVSAKLSADIAELLYFRSLAQVALARRFPEGQRDALLADAARDLDWALQWAADSQSWEAWAVYQLALAGRRLDAQQFAEAAAACRAVLDLEQPSGAALPPKLICQAADYLVQCNKARKLSCSPDQWTALLQRFPPGAAANDYWIAYLRVLRQIDSGALEAGEAAAIDRQLDSLAADDSAIQQSAHLGYRWKTYKSLHHEALALAAKDKRDVAGFLRHFREAALLAGKALDDQDKALADPVRKAFVDLQAGKSTWPVPDMQRWVAARLLAHLQATHAIRKRALSASYIYLSGAQTESREEVQALGQQCLRLEQPDIVQAFAAAEAEQWAASYVEYMKAFFPQ